MIVESPAKARTIKKYLGSGYTVKASVGHVKDLPKSKMGVDPEKGFKTEYVIIKSKGKIIEDIRKSAGNVERVYLAPTQARHHGIAIDVIRRLMDHHLRHPEDLPASYRDNDADRVTQAADYVAGMTDRFALRTHARLFGSTGMEDLDL